MIDRVIIIVLDSLGAGHAPDAAAYGDHGANTLVNMSRAVPSGLSIPTPVSYTHLTLPTIYSV